LVRHLEEDPKKFILSFKRTLRFLAAGGIFISILGVILTPFIINFFGDTEFAYSIPILRILMSGLVLFYLTQPISWFLVILKNQKYLPYVYLVSSLCNLFLNLFFIPLYSFYGAAVITLISELIILGFLVFYAKKSWKKYLVMISSNNSTAHA